MKKIALTVSGVLVVLILGLALAFYQPDIPLEKLKEKYTYSDSGFVDVQGMPAHYRRTGAGRPLLLLHGTGASLHTWEGWTEQLQDSFEVISVGLPAFGLTGPHPGQDYSIEAYTSFLHAFAREMNISEFFLAGNSLGGFIAWEYALAHPQQVKGLILICAAGWPREKSLPLVMRLARIPVLNTLMTKITPKPMFRSSLREVYFDDSKLTDTLVQRYYELFLRPGNRRAYIHRLSQPQQSNPSELKTLSLPVLIQWGIHDEWIPLEDAYRFKEVLPNASLKVYDQAGHVPMEEIPKPTAADARAFMERID